VGAAWRPPKIPSSGRVVSLSVSSQECDSDSIFISKTLGFVSTKYEAIFGIPFIFKRIPVSDFAVYVQRQLGCSDNRHRFLWEHRVLFDNSHRFLSGAKHRNRRWPESLGWWRKRAPSGIWPVPDTDPHPHIISRGFPTVLDVNLNLRCPLLYKCDVGGGNTNVSPQLPYRRISGNGYNSLSLPASCLHLVGGTGHFPSLPCDKQASNSSDDDQCEVGKVLRGKQTREVIWRLAGMALLLPFGCLLIYYNDRPVSRVARLGCSLSGVLSVGVALGLGFFPIYNQDCESYSEHSHFHSGISVPQKPNLICPQIPLSRRHIVGGQGLNAQAKTLVAFLSWNLALVDSELTLALTKSTIKAEAVVLHLFERILKANQASNRDDKDISHVLPEGFTADKNFHSKGIVIVRGERVVQSGRLRRVVIENPCSNFLQRERHVGWINDLEGNHQRSFEHRSADIGTLRLVVFDGKPLPHLDFLQPDAFPHGFSGLSCFPRLLPDSVESESGNNYKRPVGPFNGCLSFWRFFWGTACLCCMTRIVYKRDGVLWTGLAFLFGGITVVLWFTGRDNCQTENNGDNNAFHSGISVPQKHLTSNNYWGTVMDMANVLNTDKKIAVIGALAEGSSIRSIERITGVHRDTIMRLGVKVGQGCAAVMDSKMRNLPCNRLEMDEIWGFVGKKDRNVRMGDDAAVGSVWTFCAIDAETKLVPAFKVGNRDAATAKAFVQDVADRMAYRVQISTDGLSAYVAAMESAFGGDVDYAQIIKIYGHEELSNNRRYSAPEFVSSEKKIFVGNPDVGLISTSYVERLNATTRLHMRRLTRLTLAFSKKRENFEAAVALHFAYYNFVKRHSTIRCTPAMAAGVTGSFWSVGDLVEAAA
jgi:IS1 family transposase